MLILSDPADINLVGHPAIRDLLVRRFHELCQGDPYDPELHGTFLVVEGGESVESIELAGGCWITSPLFGDARFGDPDFGPSHELLEEHPACYELVFVFGDTATVIFIPKGAGTSIDPELMHYCESYAVPAAQSSA